MNLNVADIQESDMQPLWKGGSILRKSLNTRIKSQIPKASCMQIQNSRGSKGLVGRYSLH